MEKILEQLGLDAKATEADAVAAIKQLQSESKARATTNARQKQIGEKMAAGLTRDVAVEVIENQEREDADRKKAEKSK
jgi:hypothetical protein